MGRKRREDYFLFTEDIEQIRLELSREYGVNIISKRLRNGKNADGTPTYYTVYKLNDHIIMRLNDCNYWRGVSGVSFSKHCYSDDKYRKLDEYFKHNKKHPKLLNTTDGMYGFKIQDENEIKDYLNQIKINLTVGIQNSTREYDKTNLI